jgi:hypothetical protein
MLIDVVRSGRLLATGLLGVALLGLPAAFDGGRGLMARADDTDDTTVRSSATATSSSSSSSSSAKSTGKPGDCTSEASAEATTTVNGQTTTKRDHDKQIGSGGCAARASSEAKAGSDGGTVRTDATAN